MGEVSSALMMAESDFKSRYGFEKPDKNKKVVFHCKLGGRSAQACSTAENCGYKNVHNYSGFVDWFGKGY